jgi:putative ATP-dependent endonuclease of OLD family
MRLRKLEVSNFRGIRTLEWIIPKDVDLICLVGHGDSGKSSILAAINLVLGDKWNPTISDTDFFDADVSESIVIRAVVADIPAKLMKETAFGLWLSGIRDDGEVIQDPENGSEPCLIVQLVVNASLEPVWSVEKLLSPGENAELRSHHRREFATFLVEDRVDANLRWTRTSALGRLSSKDNSAKSAMSSATRAARESIATLRDAELDLLTASVQAKVNEVGGGSFARIAPGLDASQSSAGNLALYEANVPLTSYGLGTKRLASLAVQQLAAGARTLVLFDEFEVGLEPHRIVRLLAHLKSEASYSQILLTTHSAVVVEQASTDNLAVVRNTKGAVSVRFLPRGTGLPLRLRRQRPSSFLGRRILVVEGKTEDGLMRAMVHHWDREQLAAGLPISAGEGVVIQDGQGGTEAIPRASAMYELGYQTAAFIDNDDRSVDAAAATATSNGIPVIRWSHGHNTESQLVDVLDQTGLTLLLDLASDLRGNPQTVLDDLHRSMLPDEFESLRVEDWLTTGEVNVEGAKEIISSAALQSAWFKNVDGGTALGGWICSHHDLLRNTPIEAILHKARQFIYTGDTEELASAIA